MTNTNTPKFTPGQTVIRRDVNENRYGGPTEVTVVKVGRTLVHVTGRGRYGRTETFRIEDGRANDNYGHGWIQTQDEHAEEKWRDAQIARLTAHHLRFDAGAYARAVPTYTLRQIADLLDAAKEQNQ